MSQRKLEQLRERVEAAEYRGVDGKAERNGHYGWPMDFGTLQGIADAALRYIIALRGEQPPPPAPSLRAQIEALCSWVDEQHNCIAVRKSDVLDLLSLEKR